MSEAIENHPTNVLDQGDAEDDDSLDNFFKKKDKKEKKKKSKKSETGGSDKSSSKSKKKESEQHNKDSDNTKVDGTNTKDQEEWIDFVDESERDYSDLKIQNMQISNNSNEQTSGNAPEYDESGELIPPKPVEGPWKAVASSKPAPVTVAAAVTPAQPAPQAEAPKKVGAYRPPQARAALKSGNNLTPSALPKRNRRQQVPQINNEMDFPSLGQVVNDPTIPPKGFEMVKHGSKSSTWQNQREQNAKANELKLDNQFSALNNDN